PCGGAFYPQNQTHRRKNMNANYKSLDKKQAAGLLGENQAGGVSLGRDIAGSYKHRGGPGN
ncbi:hypothetical protein KW816_23885, partial [Serratia ureilytica]|uniref:hypothetical protein n=1 Tax=Serratia ureilytica TaxID=300181 RepID=UPI003BF77B02|nr:hypothetical protein [Serratia ureilytica]